MSNATYYVQECPVCGRRLQIRVEYLGRTMVCPHCRGKFVATDPASVRLDCPEVGNALLRRADELLQSVQERQRQSGVPSPN